MEGATQLVSIAGQLVGEEYRQLRGVGDQVAELSDELDTMNAILRMLSDADDGSVDHFIRVWMKQVRELAYDAEDCIHLYIFRIRCRPRDRFFVWSKRLLATLFPRRRLAREIEALRARAVVISERHARYGVGREALSRSTPPPLAAPAPVSGHALGRPVANDPDHLIGIEDQANKLAEMVKAVSNKERDTKLKVFSIVGFGGLGKTTLAMEVSRQLETDFQSQAQVSVSQAFRGSGSKDLEGLLKRMLRQIVELKADHAQGTMEEDPLRGIDKMGVEQLTGKLKDLLKDKRYLIIVDDVWTVATWDAIKSKLPDCSNGSRVIVTTRIETVASGASVDGDCIYWIERLSPENSKKLFLSRALGPSTTTLSDDLTAEMDKILKKCGGLPMAIISIASLLANYKSSESKEMWERVRKSIGSQMETHPTLEGMRQIVTLSFNHLHYYLKGCMMYLSIFPEDYVIVKNRLLRRWIAEGLVAEIRGLTLMEVAEAYYNELVSRSMIDRADDIITYYDGRVETCRVHDMMLEVMVSRSLESNFVSLVGGSYEGMSYDRIRRLSIHGGEEATEDSPSNNTAAGHSRKNGIEGVKMEHVRSLSMFGPEDHTKVLDRLDEFTLLRVLDLEDCMGIKNEHMRYVCRMYLLRFLSLKGTAISEMPEEVGELENLETLDARETYLKDLPKTVSKLQKLEHLQITNNDNNSDGWIARQGQGRMKALRMVNKLVLKCDAKAAEEIGELQQLRELNMIVDTEDNDMSGHLAKEVNQKLAESLSKMFSLRWLNIRSASWDRNNAMIFLHDMKSPPQLLQYLRISGGIDKLPDWVGSLNNLVELFIAWTFLVGDQLFGPVCKLPNLKRLRLEMNCYQDRVLVAQTAHSFPALTHLYVDGNLEVLQFQKGSMAKLEILSAYHATQRSNRIDGLGHLTNLKEVKLIGKKDNPDLDHALKQLKIMNEKRQNSNQIKVVVKYD